MRTVLKGILLAAVIAVSTEVNAQVKADPGVSSHNYKHPNKAKKAGSEKNTVEVSTLSEVQKQEDAKTTHKVSTPKYKKRHATLTTTKQAEGSGVKVNPMKSSGNYKAGK